MYKISLSMYCQRAWWVCGVDSTVPCNPDKSVFDYDKAYLEQMQGVVAGIRAQEAAILKKNKDAEKNYQIALKEGDKGFSKKDYAGALAKYNEALSLKKDDAVAKQKIEQTNAAMKADADAAKTAADAKAKAAADKAAADKAAADKAAADKAAADKAAAEKAAAEKAAADKAAAEKAAAAKAAAAKAAAEKAAAEKAAAEKAAADKAAADKAAADKAAADKAAADKAAADKAAADKAAAEKAAADKAAAEKAAADKAAADKAAAAKAAADKAAADKAAADKAAADKAAADKAAADKAAADKAAADKAAADKAAADKAAADKAAAEKAAADKAAADKAAASKSAAEKAAADKAVADKAAADKAAASKSAADKTAADKAAADKAAADKTAADKAAAEKAAADKAAASKSAAEKAAAEKAAADKAAADKAAADKLAADKAAADKAAASKSAAEKAAAEKAAADKAAADKVAADKAAADKLAAEKAAASKSAAEKAAAEKSAAEKAAADKAAAEKSAAEKAAAEKAAATAAANTTSTTTTAEKRRSKGLADILSRPKKQHGDQQQQISPTSDEDFPTREQRRSGILTKSKPPPSQSAGAAFDEPVIDDRAGIDYESTDAGRKSRSSGEFFKLHKRRSSSSRRRSFSGPTDLARAAATTAGSESELSEVEGTGGRQKKRRSRKFSFGRRTGHTSTDTGTETAVTDFSTRSEGTKPELTHGGRQAAGSIGDDIPQVTRAQEDRLTASQERLGLYQEKGQEGHSSANAAAYSGPTEQGLSTAFTSPDTRRELGPRYSPGTTKVSNSPTYPAGITHAPQVQSESAVDNNYESETHQAQDTLESEEMMYNTPPGRRPLSMDQSYRPSPLRNEERPGVPPINTGAAVDTGYRPAALDKEMGIGSVASESSPTTRKAVRQSLPARATDSGSPIGILRKRMSTEPMGSPVRDQSPSLARDLQQPVFVHSSGARLRTNSSDALVAAQRYRSASVEKSSPLIPRPPPLSMVGLRGESPVRSPVQSPNGMTSPTQRAPESPRQRDFTAGSPPVSPMRSTMPSSLPRQEAVSRQKDSQQQQPAEQKGLDLTDRQRALINSSEMIGMSQNVMTSPFDGPSEDPMGEGGQRQGMEPPQVPMKGHTGENEQSINSFPRAQRMNTQDRQSTDIVNTATSNTESDRTNTTGMRRRPVEPAQRSPGINDKSAYTENAAAAPPTAAQYMTPQKSSGGLFGFRKFGKKGNDSATPGSSSRNDSSVFGPGRGDSAYQQPPVNRQRVGIMQSLRGGRNGDENYVDMSNVRPFHGMDSSTSELKPVRSETMPSLSQQGQTSSPWRSGTSDMSAGEPSSTRKRATAGIRSLLKGRGRTNSQQSTERVSDFGMMQARPSEQMSSQRGQQTTNEGYEHRGPSTYTQSTDFPIQGTGEDSQNGVDRSSRDEYRPAPQNTEPQSAPQQAGHPTERERMYAPQVAQHDESMVTNDQHPQSGLREAPRQEEPQAAVESSPSRGRPFPGLRRRSRSQIELANNAQASAAQQGAMDPPSTFDTRQRVSSQSPAPVMSATGGPMDQYPTEFGRPPAVSMSSKRSGVSMRPSNRRHDSYGPSINEQLSQSQQSTPFQYGSGPGQPGNYMVAGGQSYNQPQDSTPRSQGPKGFMARLRNRSRSQNRLAEEARRPYAAPTQGSPERSRSINQGRSSAQKPPTSFRGAPESGAAMTEEQRTNSGGFLSRIRTRSRSRTRGDPSPDTGMRRAQTGMESQTPQAPRSGLRARLGMLRRNSSDRRAEEARKRPPLLPPLRGSTFRTLSGEERQARATMQEPMRPGYLAEQEAVHGPQGHVQYPPRHHRGASDGAERSGPFFQQALDRDQEIVEEREREIEAERIRRVGEERAPVGREEPLEEPRRVPLGVKVPKLAIRQQSLERERERVKERPEDYYRTRESPQEREALERRQEQGMNMERQPQEDNIDMQQQQQQQRERADMGSQQQRQPSATIAQQHADQPPVTHRRQTEHDGPTDTDTRQEEDSYSASHQPQSTIDQCHPASLDNTNPPANREQPVQATPIDTSNTLPQAQRDGNASALGSPTLGSSADRPTTVISHPSSDSMTLPTQSKAAAIVEQQRSSPKPATPSRVTGLRRRALGINSTSQSPASTLASESADTAGDTLKPPIQRTPTGKTQRSEVAQSTVGSLYEGHRGKTLPSYPPLPDAPEEAIDDMSARALAGPPIETGPAPPPKREFPSRMSEERMPMDSPSRVGGSLRSRFAAGSLDRRQESPSLMNRTPLRQEVPMNQGGEFGRPSADIDGARTGSPASSYRTGQHSLEPRIPSGASKDLPALPPQEYQEPSSTASALFSPSSQSVGQAPLSPPGLDPLLTEHHPFSRPEIRPLHNHSHSHSTSDSFHTPSPPEHNSPRSSLSGGSNQGTQARQSNVGLREYLNSKRLPLPPP